MHTELKKIIGSYMAVMNGLDAIIFTAELGEFFLYQEISMY
jgi:acetate kinase